MALFLNDAQRADSPDTIYREIIQGWKSANPEEGEYSTLGMIIRNPKVSIVALVDLAKKLNWYFDSMVMVLASYPDDDRCTLSYNRLNELFFAGGTGPGADAIKRLISQLQPKDISYSVPPPTGTGAAGTDDTIVSVPVEVNRSLIEFLTQKYRELANYAPVPEWILKGKQELQAHNIEDDPTSFSLKLPSAGKTAEILTKKLYAHMTDSDERREKLEEVYAEIKKIYSEGTNFMYLYHLLQPVYISMFLERDTDLHLQRLFGPANFFISPIENSIPQSSRMFTCSKFMEADPFDDLAMAEIADPGPFDWFNDNCDVCLRKIEAYHHAVRMPVEGGGWLGCYCSWKCVRDDIPIDTEGADTDGAGDTGDGLLNTSGIRNFLVNYFEGKISKTHIYDRPVVDDDTVVLEGERELTLPEFYEKQKELYENHQTDIINSYGDGFLAALASASNTNPAPWKSLVDEPGLRTPGASSSSSMKKK